MSRTPRARFWAEVAVALVGGFLSVLTLVWHDWIELAFRVDPDRHGGSLEWAIAGALLLVALVSSLTAGWEWRRTVTAAGAGAAAAGD